ncbi:MAG: 50S ribosomal protein L25 [Ilumatobacteraceae bacterium]
MSATVLVAESGRATGSANSRRLLREDRIPAVVYGQGMSPISISVARRDLRIALSGAAGTNTVLDLTVDGSVYPAIVKEIQRHPVRRTVQHVDFIQVNLDQTLKVSVPVRLEGEASEVLSNGGLVDLSMNEIEVETTPRSIPDEIVIDISGLTMDSTVTVGQIPLPAGVTATADADAVVVSVLATRAPAPAAADDEAEAADTGEAAAAADDADAGESSDAE